MTKWRGRFVRQRLEGLSDEPRPGRPRTITDEQVEQVITKTLEAPPPRQDTHWSTRQLARATGMSQTAVSRIWRAFGLKPLWWRPGSCRPIRSSSTRSATSSGCTWTRRRRRWCCVWMRSPRSRRWTAPHQACRSCQHPARRTHDDVRNGTSSLFAALDVASGKVISAVHRRHRHQEFLKFLKTIEATVPAELGVHVICDNYATHNTQAIKTWFLRHPRFHLHFTPTYSSWLNLVERWFAELTTRKLCRSAHRSVAELEADLTAWIQAGTTTRARWCGPRLLTRSSTTSQDIFT